MKIIRQKANQWLPADRGGWRRLTPKGREGNVLYVDCGGGHSIHICQKLSTT